ncbi:MAG: T9SS type A sorting domain-containing protein [Flavobacteriales bacterium]|nr:T9SS type A sorting domain-containing protein [Flavobacteriales bacterium]
MAFAQFPLVDVSLEHDQANDQLKISLRANDFDFGDIVSNMVFTVRWLESSPATLGFGTSEWCPSPTTALPLAPSAMVTPGNGFKYRTWNAIGLAALSEIQDNGGCGQTLLADTWTQVFTIAVNNDLGGTVFTIAEDQYAIDNNRTFYVSLNGQPSTGSVYTFSTMVAPIAPQSHHVLSLWPNPSTGLVMVDWSAHAPAIMGLEVLDATGRVVRRWGAIPPPRTLDLQGIGAGAYYVRAIAGEEVFQAPLVLE